MLKGVVRRLVRGLGYDLVRRADGALPDPVPEDFDDAAVQTIRQVGAFTMTSPERVFALIQAVRYVVDAGIPGSIVECGVWRGGSMMAVALTLGQLGVSDRDLLLFDTFEGMPEPGDADVSYEGESALETYRETQRDSGGVGWCYATKGEVAQHLLETGYPSSRVFLVEGTVENTIPEQAPEAISILRLDTDWYESTKHELSHLYPRLSPGGVLIVDDYGHWLGARKAVDEYFSESGQTPVLLNRVDYTGVIAVKALLAHA